MAAHDGDAHAGAAHLQLRQVHYASALVLQLHLLRGVAAELLAAYLRNDIIRYLIRKDLGVVALALGYRLDLAEELLRTCRARSGDRLIRGHDHALDGRDGVERVDGGAGYDGGAVGVRDYALVQLNVLGVYFGHHERHVGAKAERAGVINKNRARCLYILGKALRDVVFSSAEDDVETLEVFSARLDDGVTVNDLARRVFAGKQAKLRDREAALCQNVHHFLTDGARCAENADVVFFHGNYLTLRNCYIVRARSSQNHRYLRRRLYSARPVPERSCGC